MPRILDRRASGWLGLLGVVATSLGATGCPGTLDPALLGNGTGTGGTGGGGGTGGTVTCDVTTIFTQSQGVVLGCTTTGCHNTSDAPVSAAGLDLTLNATIGSRLVGVVSPGDTAAGSVCSGVTTPYLNPGQNPATGLLIDKITLPSGSAGLCPGGTAMPYPGINRLTATQITCVEQWAEGLIMAAGAQ
jgi:hypothetical protein